MKRSQISPLPAYFERYILMTDDVTVNEALQTSLSELEQLNLSEYEKIGDKIYAPGKWTIKDIWQHIIDTERVFVYRATAFARGQYEVTGYEQDDYVQMARATQRTLESLHQEAIALRKSTFLFFDSLDEDMLRTVGKSFKGTYTVRDLGFIIAGHQRWHERVIEEKYVPLLAQE